MKKTMFIIIFCFTLLGATLLYARYSNSIMEKSAMKEGEQAIVAEEKDLDDIESLENEIAEQKNAINILESEIDNNEKNVVFYQNKITELNRTITLLESKIKALEEKTENKAVGTWIGKITYGAEYVYKGEQNVKFIFNKNGIAIYNIAGIYKLEYTYNDNMIMRGNSIMFYNITNGNVMTIYYNSTSASGVESLNSFKLTKVLD